MSALAPPAPELGAPLAERLSARDVQNGAVLAAMRARLDEGRAAVRGYFDAGGSADLVRVELSALMDDTIRGALDWARHHHFGSANPTTGEQLAVIAVGGYGRGEMAPYSDVDLLFLHSYKRTPYAEQMAEFLLYRLWDLGLKVGQATRSITECIKLAKDDLTVRTALLEARMLWGDEPLHDELRRQFTREVLTGGGPAFIEAKLGERDQRHQRVGDSRFLLEPNVKEGKGGLRDLQTLMWLGRFIFDAHEPGDLVRHGILTRSTLHSFLRCRRFLWTVRCHLHWLSGRAEERLTFDLQAEIAKRMGYRDRPRSLGVERFMKHYYLTARDVGSLTRVIVAALEDRKHRSPRFGLPRFGFGRRKLGDFEVQGARLAIIDPTLFTQRPIAMLELFHTAQERGLDIHPQALAAVSHALPLVGRGLRDDPEANRLFLEILTSRKDPALTLTRMNEAELLGRFVPDFGRIVAQMQYNLYHVFTVDEHTIQAVSILGQIERGEIVSDLPLATEIMPKLLSRSELYLALFFHDVGKGRGGDHSRIGAEIARRNCKRMGLSDPSIETIVWLVAHHLVMSEFAFKRDAEDPKTIQDFVAIVQSPERLRLLLVLTVADIRAVGPAVWNGWKGQLLRELYHEAAAAMASGDPQGRRTARIEGAKREVGRALAAGDNPWSREAIDAYLQRHDPRYWLGFGLEDQVRHAQLIREADHARSLLTVDFRVDRFRATTEIVIYAPDHPGLFMKIAGALAISSVNIVSAHIFTTSDGMALDVLGFQDADGRSAVDDPERHRRIAHNIEKALGGEIWLDKALEGRRRLPTRTDVFQVEPRVLVDNMASRTHSVIEINGRDRPGLLYHLAKTLKDLGLVIHSAHIGTYGARAVDVFYVKDVFGMKVTAKNKLARIDRQLGAVLGAPAVPS